MDAAIDATGLGLMDNMIQMKSLTSESEEERSAAQLTDQTVEIDDENHQKILDYLLVRLRASAGKRMNRLSRYARIDQMVVTWQKLTPEDTKREIHEDNTGRQQALPMTIPLAQSHVDDTVAFFSEIFAPLGGNFYSLPGKPEKTGAVKALADEMNQDTLINNYYANVTQAMRQICKYNICGFDVWWEGGDPQGVGTEKTPGNVVDAIDMYNVDWDQTVKDVEKICKDAEWAARFRTRNRLWIMKQAAEGNIINADKVLNPNMKTSSTQSETWNQGKAQFYRDPPAQTKMATDGSDQKTAEGENGGIDWAQFGLGLNSDAYIDILGHEIVKMYCWINPNQFELSDDGEDKLELWQFLICDGRVIIQARAVTDAREIPMYFGRVNKDINMRETMRSISEYIRPFQRFVSFLVNTHVEATRGAIWGIKAYDPTAIDASALKSGETSGLIPTLPGAAGRDVRSIIADLRNNLDTKGNIEDAAGFLELMKQFFPNQNLPAQISGIDRAVTSQVSAVLQGAMRKMHMLARLIDSDIMLPSRQQQYRNIATLSPNKSSFQGITEEDVAQLLASGLGQINREAAAEQVRQLIFALLQNPNTMQTIDLASMFNFWSSLMNIGTNLGDFVIKQPTGPIDATVPNPGGTNGAQAPAVAA